MTATWNDKAFVAKVRAACLRAVVATVEDIIAEGTRLIASPPKTGRVYVKDNPRRVHQASAPGQAPATDLGFLIASSLPKYPPPTENEISGIANWGAEYALCLELGTRKIMPRPFARPALDHATPAFKARVHAEVGAAAK